MASAANSIVAGVRRLPEDVRAELDKALKRTTWQALTREFSIDTFTGLEKKGLDCISELIDSSNKECVKDVQKRVNLLKNLEKGKAQSFKGKSTVGFRCSFYRFWLVGERRQDGLYDILFCHINRKEDFDFFLFLKKSLQGTADVIRYTPKAILSMLPAKVRSVLELGEVEDEPAPYANRDLTQELGDRLAEYELIEMLIDRGTLVPQDDGNLVLRLH